MRKWSRMPRRAAPARQRRTRTEPDKRVLLVEGHEPAVDEDREGGEVLKPPGEEHPERR
eukprot:CAMPEP_0180180692 /NCGR_PEP_ID=MMETSP0986-20121125/39721_1 /TAXON_ID=697907 /ORGANISM="non described non described, Strain CCMP2293" /LENGTH=58 /DNA_ID=CAMNT_0022133917 /DNA_START=263 /DNA_END=435 /DNA_ORIENTATION=-